MSLSSFLALQEEQIRQVGRTTPHYAGPSSLSLIRIQEYGMVDEMRKDKE